MTNFKPGIDRVEYGGAMIGLDEVKAVMDVMLSQGGRRWTVGPESEAFESELASTAGVKRAVVTNSGSSSLLLAMTALHLPKGSKVIIPATTFPTAFNVILQNGLIPVVIDVEPKTFNLSFAEVKKAIEQHPDIAAVLAVDISGNPVDLVELREIIGNRKLILDNCDGFGTKLRGKFIDSYADVSCVSFHAAHIITTGEGGAVLTNDEDVANAAKKLREWGRASGSDTLTKHPGFPPDYRERYVYEEIGFNIKPLELQCAMGRVQLRRLPEFMGKRAENFKKMERVFLKYPQFEGLTYIEDAEPCWMHYPFIVKGERGRVMDTLEKANVETRTVFSGNILKHPAYKNIEAIQIGDLANAEYIMAHGMFISVHPSLTDEMISYIDSILAEL